MSRKRHAAFIEMSRVPPMIATMKLDDVRIPGTSPVPAPTALRIALVTETYPPEINGVAMTLGRMAGALRECEHTVDVVRPRQVDDGTSSADLLVKGLPIPGYGDLRFGLPAARTLMRRWSEHRPHIVHIATQGPLGWSARKAARALGLPVSSGFHTNFDAYSRHYGIGWMQAPIARALRSFHNGTDTTMVPTRSLARSLLSSGYRNVSVVSRGIDTQLFSPQRRSASLRADWKAKPDDLVVAYVGRLAPEKNLDLVFATFSEVLCARHDAKLVLVGDGPLYAALRTRYPQHIFTGMQRGENLATHYASADMFLFPSLTETFGNVTVEALASGLGVIGYDYAAAAELIEDGHNGLLATPDDANGFINSAVMLATDRSLLARMRTRAALSVAHLDWIQVADIFASRLRNLIAMHEVRRAPGRVVAIKP